MYGSNDFATQLFRGFMNIDIFFKIACTEPKYLVQYFPRLAILNFIFDFILSCFFLYLKVYVYEQNVNNDVTKDSPSRWQGF